MNPKVPSGRAGAFREYTKKLEEDGVKLLDPQTIQFNLAFASGAFIQFLALDYVKVLPKHILQEVGEFKQADPIIQRKAGSGPFQLTEYKRGDSIKMVKNKTYFKAGRPYFDGINHFIIVDNGRLIAAFKSGQLDMQNSGFTNLGATDYLQLVKDMKGAILIHELPGSRNWGLMLNVKKEKLKDPRVRKAIYLALDRQELNQLLEDGTAALPTIFMPGFAYTEKEALTWPGLRPKNTPGGQEDLKEAKKLMADAGYPNGFTTTFDARQVGNYPDTCSLVKQQLKRTLGIDGEVRSYESAAGYALFGTSRNAEGNWELACQGEGMTVLDPDAVFGGVYRKGATRNYPNWSHPVIDDLFEKQKREPDLEKRKALLRQTEDFLRGFEDNHWITLFWGKFFWVVNKDIRGLNPPQTVQYGFYHEDLWLDR
jgi:peptide/nickel transport system substrate-binding protein